MFVCVYTQQQGYGGNMTLTRKTTQKTRDSNVKRQTVKEKYKGIPAGVLTPPQKDEILLEMAEALGFYDPT